MTWDNYSSLSVTDVFRLEICRGWEENSNEVIISGGRRTKINERVVSLGDESWKETAQSIIQELLTNPESCHIYETVPYGKWLDWQNNNMVPNGQY